MLLHLGSGNGQCFVPREKIADTVTYGSMELASYLFAAISFKYLNMDCEKNKDHHGCEI
jgi:hypothetical protein